MKWAVNSPHGDWMATFPCDDLLLSCAFALRCLNWAASYRIACGSCNAAVALCLPVVLREGCWGGIFNLVA